MVHNKKSIDEIISSIDLDDLDSYEIVRIEGVKKDLGITGDLTADQKRAIIESHEYKLNTPKQNFPSTNYVKGRALRNAGFSSDQTRIIMENGWAGKVEIKFSEFYEKDLPYYVMRFTDGNEVAITQKGILRWIKEHSEVGATPIMDVVRNADGTPLRDTEGLLLLRPKTEKEVNNLFFQKILPQIEKQFDLDPLRSQFCAVVEDAGEEKNIIFRKIPGKYDKIFKYYVGGEHLHSERFKR